MSRTIIRHSLPASALSCLIRTIIPSFVIAYGLGAPQGPGPCTEGDATRIVELLECFSLEQLKDIVAYRNPDKDERLMRETLATAAGIVGCMDGYRSFPQHPQQRKDFHCLQRLLLDFYERANSEQENAGEFHFQDLLAHANLKIHYCMIDEDLPLTKCLGLMGEAFESYRKVFDSAGQVHSQPDSPVSSELIQSLGINPETPAPDFSTLADFIDLCLENARRFPMLLGKPAGEALRPILCDSFHLYPDRRPYVAHHYNLLIRFDGGNLAAASRLYHFMQVLATFFQPVAGAPSFLELNPADWGNSPPPCGEDDWMFNFPEMSIRSGYRLPEMEVLKDTLTVLEESLEEAARFGEQRIHIWKPFQSYGKLLFGLAQSMKPEALRNRKARESRHFLMEKARDALVLRSVEPAKYPLDVKVLRPPIRQQITSYGTELLSDLQLDALIKFSEGYFEANQSVLDQAEKTLLHRQLAIAYAVKKDQEQALDHLQQSDLQPSELETIVTKFGELGVGHDPIQ